MKGEQDNESVISDNWFTPRGQAPMAKLSVDTWIGNAAACLCGEHGDVTQQAEIAGCSRQTVYDHAQKVQRAVEDARIPGPSREQLLAENAKLRKENDELWEAYAQSIDCPQEKLRQFSTVASAMGLSLCQILVLLAIFLPPARQPSRATLGRWVNQSARRASRLLAVLGKVCRPLVLAMCLDEIFFHRRPVLMGVEPHSMAWLIGDRAPDRTGETWAKTLEDWTDLEDVAIDGGSGLQRGIKLAAAKRRKDARKTPGKAAKPLHGQLDNFHTRRDAARTMQQVWKRAEAAWDEAVKLERALEQQAEPCSDEQRQIDKQKVEQAWAKALPLFEQACREEKALERAVAALKVFRPDGQLNNRAWAEAELRAAAAELPGEVWAKVRRALLDPRSLTFLDRLHEKLEKAEPCPERRAALVKLWQWRRESAKTDEAGTGTAAAEVGELLQEVVKTQLGENWKESYRRVSQALWRVLRASSAVECVNSVVRMHQARHRNVTQEMLDLKRLYWNCRTFHEGKRKKHCPYELLGLSLPSYDPWVLLQMDPAELEKSLGVAQK
jgi:hypothetical protein